MFKKMIPLLFLFFIMPALPVSAQTDADDDAPPWTYVCPPDSIESIIQMLQDIDIDLSTGNIGGARDEMFQAMGTIETVYDQCFQRADVFNGLIMGRYIFEDQLSFSYPDALYVEFDVGETDGTILISNQRETVVDGAGIVEDGFLVSVSFNIDGIIFDESGNPINIEADGDTAASVMTLGLLPDTPFIEIIDEPFIDNFGGNMGVAFRYLDTSEDSHVTWLLLQLAEDVLVLFGGASLEHMGDFVVDLLIYMAESTSYSR